MNRGLRRDQKALSAGPAIFRIFGKSFVTGLESAQLILLIPFTESKMDAKQKINGFTGFSPCLWMQAGVVRKKECRIDYECPACRFDRVMRKTAGENRNTRLVGRVPEGNRGAILFWKERMRKLPAWQRPCIHHMKGRIDFRACTQSYRCRDCDFDQYFKDQYAVHTVVRPVDVLDIEGFKIPQGYYFHRGHTWLKMEEGGTVRVGIDDFALRLLGPPDAIEAPLMGKPIRQDQPHILLRRGEKRAALLSPVSGVVTDINPALRETGGLANKAPYSDGWVMRVHAENLRKDLKNLMIGTEARDVLETEIDQLYGAIEEVAPLAADGGFLGYDIYGSMPQLGWDRLSRMFLHTAGEDET